MIFFFVKQSIGNKHFILEVENVDHITFVVSNHGVGNVGIRPNNSQSLDGLGVQGKGALEILEKHNALPCSIDGQLLVLIRAHILGPELSIGLLGGIPIEEAQPHEHREVVRDGSINGRFIELAGVNSSLREAA